MEMSHEIRSKIIKTRYIFPRTRINKFTHKIEDIYSAES